MQDPSSPPKGSLTFPIAWVLPGLLTFLVVATVLPILATTYFINRSNADALLSARAELIVDGLENQLRGLLDPVADQLEIAREYIEARELDFNDQIQFQTYIEGLLGGMPQVEGMGVIRPNGSMRRWERGRNGAIEEPASALPLVNEALEIAPRRTDVFWSAPFVSLVLGDTILNPRMTVRRNGQMAGILTVGVTGERLSKYVASLSRENITAFIIYDRDKLIAYPNPSSQDIPIVSTDLRTIDQSSTEEIRQIWGDQNPLTQTSRMERTQGHWQMVNGIPYVYFYREISGYAPQDLLVGVVIPSSESRWFRWAATIAAGFGILLLLVAALIAMYLGRRIAKPVIQLQQGLANLETMDFDKAEIPGVSRSRISEWKDSALSLSKTAQALTSFNQYVPGSLARRLMANPENAAKTQDRFVTVMFIDLEGFTNFADKHDASHVAASLNAVFGHIGPIIESTGGVIDKYTGDGLMAFWGAPDDMEEHATNAVSAALQIRETFSSDLPSDVPDNLPRLRIGISTGRVIVGNLGFKGRWNYTLIGKTVNTAQRVEQGMRGLLPEQKVVIGLTTETANEVDFSAFGEFPSKTETPQDGMEISVL